MWGLTSKDVVILFERVTGAVLSYIIVINTLHVADPIYIIIGTMSISFIISKMVPW